MNLLYLIILVIVLVYLLLYKKEKFQIRNKYFYMTEEEKEVLIENDFKKMDNFPLKETPLEFEKTGYKCSDYEDVATS